MKKTPTYKILTDIFLYIDSKPKSVSRFAELGGTNWRSAKNALAELEMLGICKSVCLPKRSRWYFVDPKWTPCPTYGHEIYQELNGRQPDEWWYGYAKCRNCRELHEWWCPKSPDHLCHYEEKDHMRDTCIYCGLPEERD